MGLSIWGMERGPGAAAGLFTSDVQSASDLQNLGIPLRAGGAGSLGTRGSWVPAPCPQPVIPLRPPKR